MGHERILKIQNKLKEINVKEIVLPDLRFTTVIKAVHKTGIEINAGGQKAQRKQNKTTKTFHTRLSDFCQGCKEKTTTTTIFSTNDAEKWTPGGKTMVFDFTSNHVDSPKAYVSELKLQSCQKKTKQRQKMKQKKYRSKSLGHQFWQLSSFGHYTQITGNEEKKQMNWTSLK